MCARQPSFQFKDALKPWGFKTPDFKRTQLKRMEAKEPSSHTTRPNPNSANRFRQMTFLLLLLKQLLQRWRLSSSHARAHLSLGWNINPFTLHSQLWDTPSFFYLWTIIFQFLLCKFALRLRTAYSSATTEYQSQELFLDSQLPHLFRFLINEKGQPTTQCSHVTCKWFQFVFIISKTWAYVNERIKTHTDERISIQFSTKWNISKCIQEYFISLHVHSLLTYSTQQSPSWGTKSFGQSSHLPSLPC